MPPPDTRLLGLRPLLVTRASAMIGARHYGSGAPLPDDLAQLALLKLSQSAAAAALSGDDLRRFALTTLHHVFLDECARRRRELLSLDDAPVDEAASDAAAHAAIAFAGAVSERADDVVVERHERALRRAALTAAIAGLPDIEREFLRASLDTGSAPAAQRRTGWPPGGASSACQARNRIVERLRRALIGGGGA